MRATEDSVLVVARRRYLRELGLPTIFGAAVLFVSATLLLGVNISALRSNLVWVDHSHQALRNIANLETAILGEELTIRGFALTGDKRFLLYQEDNRTRTVKALKALGELTSSEPEHRKVFQTIAPDVERHLAIYWQLRGTGPDKAARVAYAITDKDTRAITDRIRARLNSLRIEEEADLSVRMREMTAQISRAFFLSIGIILAAVLLGGFGLLASQLPLSMRR